MRTCKDQEQSRDNLGLSGAGAGARGWLHGGSGWESGVGTRAVGRKFRMAEKSSENLEQSVVCSGWASREGQGGGRATWRQWVWVLGWGLDVWDGSWVQIAEKSAENLHVRFRNPCILDGTS